MNPGLQGNTALLQGGAPQLQQTATPGIGGNVTPANQTTNTATIPANQTTNTATIPGGGGTTSTISPLIAQGINQEYGSAIAAGNTEYGQAQANMPINLQNLNNTTQAQINSAQQQTAGQVGTYNQQIANTQAQQNLSLSELAAQIRAQNQGLQAQLGAVGAGSSSAAGMGQQGLAQEQNTDRANIQEQTQANVGLSNSEIQAAQNNLAQYIPVIQTYKAQQTAGIVQAYNQTLAQLAGAIGQASGEQKRELGLYADQLTDTATTQLNNLNNEVSQAAAQIAQQQAMGSQQGQQFTALPTGATPTAITTPNASPFQITPVNTQNTTAAPVAGGGLNALLQQQQNQTAS